MPELSVAALSKLTALRSTLLREVARVELDGRDSVGLRLTQEQLTTLVLLLNAAAEMVGDGQKARAMLGLTRGGVPLPNLTVAEMRMVIDVVAGLIDRVATLGSVESFLADRPS